MPMPCQEGRPGRGESGEVATGWAGKELRDWKRLSPVCGDAQAAAASLYRGQDLRGPSPEPIVLSRLEVDGLKQPVIAPASGELDNKRVRSDEQVQYDQRIADIRDMKMAIIHLGRSPASSSQPITAPVPQRSKHTPARAPTVFLCYRREDTQDAADRLHERLALTSASRLRPR